MAKPVAEILQTVDGDWVAFPGGELEGKRPKRLCAPCRERARRTGRHEQEATTSAEPRSRVPFPICFQCYREELDRERRIAAAANLDTASEARFQDVLPLEPVDTARLAMLKVQRAGVRATARAGTGRFVDRRRHAQIAARHTLQAIGAGLRQHLASANIRDQAVGEALHAAELQLPESWLPFVGAR